MKTIYKKSGIYKIICLVNNKVYIGSSIDTKVRIRKHKESLRRKKHENNYLQNTYNKYGLDLFSYEVIEEVDDKVLLLEREQFWINAFKSNIRENGFNLKPNASSMLGFKKTEESKLKISKKWIVTNPAGLEIEVINLNKFCQENNLSQANMSSVAYGIVGKCKGYKCRQFHMTKNDWEKLVISKSKNKWHLVSATGKEFWIRSKDLKNFCKENNLSVYSIYDVSRGRILSVKGWTAKFYD